LKTLKQICLYDQTLVDSEGNKLELKRGQEYITGLPNLNNEVMVFSTYWVKVPANWFAGEQKFTQ